MVDYMYITSVFQLKNQSISLTSFYIRVHLYKTLNKLIFMIWAAEYSTAITKISNKI